MLARHMYNDNEEIDFPLYPDPQAMFSQSFSFGAQGFSTDASYNAGVHANGMYAAETPQYALESPDLRSAPSNYSTASGPSATSSAMGSPHSMHGHAVPIPEWAPQGLGLTPSIVGYDSYGHGNEYTFQTTGTDDFALEFNPGKPNGFVGECETSRSRQHGSLSSTCSSVSTFVPSPIALDTPIDQISGSATGLVSSPITPVSSGRTGSRDGCFRSPSVSAFSRSPTSSRTFSGPRHPSLGLTGRSPELRSPVSSVSQNSASESSPSYATFQQSHFFSQSSGNFVPPLESSCWFPLSLQHHWSNYA
jgi:hypothetical protein